MDKLSDYVKVYPNVIPDHVCDMFVELFEKHKDKSRYFPLDDYRYHRLSLFNYPELHDYATAVMSLLGNISKQYFTQVNSDHMIYEGDDLIFGDTTIKKYDPDQTHKLIPHTDNGDAITAVRYLTMVGYLVDNDEGATYFPKLDVRVPCKKGSVALFPPTWQYQHMGEHCVKTPKYIIMCELHWPTMDPDYGVQKY